jgi:hypothetical protein
MSAEEWLASLGPYLGPSTSTPIYPNTSAYEMVKKTPPIKESFSYYNANGIEIIVGHRRETSEAGDDTDLTLSFNRKQEEETKRDRDACEEHGGKGTIEPFPLKVICRQVIRAIDSPRPFTHQLPAPLLRYVRCQDAEAEATGFFGDSQ